MKGGEEEERGARLITPPSYLGNLTTNRKLTATLRLPRSPFYSAHLNLSRLLHHLEIKALGTPKALIAQRLRLPLWPVPSKPLGAR